MRKVTFVFLGLAALFLAVPAFAQGGGGGGGAAAPVNWVAITAGFAMAIASGVCAMAQAKATAAAAEGLARNPAAAPAIRFALILALVLIESMALYTLAMIIVKVK